MATTFLEVKNRAYSLLAAAIDNNDLSLEVTSGEGSNFPSAFPFHLTIEDEIVSVTNRVGDVCTIVRAQQGTDAAEHVAGVSVKLNITAKSVSDLNTAVNALEVLCPSAAVLEADFNANTILYATTNNTPVALSIAASRIVGRKASGGIAALTGAEALALMTTALKAELDLLDLAGLTAGELLVATGAAAVAWQSTGVKLSAPDISGVVTAASALTMPAFTLGGAVTLNGQTLDAGSDHLEVATTGCFKGIQIISTQDGVTGARLALRQIKATQAVDDIISTISCVGKDSGGDLTTYVDIYGIVASPTSGSEDGKLSFNLQNVGTWNEAMTLSGAGLAWFDVGINADEYYKVAGTQVVAAQGAAVADATDASSVILRLNELLARCRTHGLIAT